MNLSHTRKRPPSGRNNVWYEYNRSETLFVFVHGILSDSRDAWYYRGDEPETSTYWPDLVATDDFNNPSVFLGGFYTEALSGDYTIRDAAEELFGYLSVSLDPADKPALSKPNIVFVAHSLGGIAVRHMLLKKQNIFREKNLGLVLVASPSIGSKDADRLDFAIDLVNQKMAEELQWKNATLVNLDKDFRNFVDQYKNKNLVGLELLENHFYVKIFLLFRKTVLVEEESASRYFESIRIGDTDHNSIAKPSSDTDPMHIQLRKFFQYKFLPMVQGNPRSYDTSRIRASNLPDIEEIRALFFAIHEEYKMNFVQYLAHVDSGGEPQEIIEQMQDVNILTADDRARLVRLVKRYDDLLGEPLLSDDLMGLMMQYFGISDSNHVYSLLDDANISYQRWRTSIRDDVVAILAEDWQTYFDPGCSRPPKSDWKPEIRNQWEDVRGKRDNKFSIEKFKEYAIRHSISSNLQESQRLAIKIEAAIDDLAAGQTPARP